MKSHRLIAGVAAAGALALVLAGCVPNAREAAGAGSRISISASDSACDLSTSTVASGAVTFTITNTGSDVTELEILAHDKVHIVGEKENIGPGTSPRYVAQLEPGTYYTSCKPGMVGTGVGESTLVVTDSGRTIQATDQKRISQALTNYISYAKEQAGQLVTDTKAFVLVFEAGDITTAKDRYPGARAHYERIEPLAEKFPELDTALDVRAADLATGDPWTGWHRIEKDLWPPTGYVPLDRVGRAALGAKLNSDTQKLYALLHSGSLTVTLSDVSNGAIAVMDEVATRKITGEEEIYSHTDLWDFQANIEGAKISFDSVRSIASSKSAKGKALVAEIDADFATLAQSLAQYGSLSTGYPLYPQLSNRQIQELSDQVNALAEPLSRLTAVVLH